MSIPTSGMSYGRCGAAKLHEYHSSSTLHRHLTATWLDPRASRSRTLYQFLVFRVRPSLPSKFIITLGELSLQKSHLLKPEAWSKHTPSDFCLLLWVYSCCHLFEPRALYMRGKHSSTETQPSPTHFSISLHLNTEPQWKSEVPFLPPGIMSPG